MKTKANIERMKSYTKALETKWRSDSSDLTAEIERAQIPHSNVVSLEDEDDEFLKEFN